MVFFKKLKIELLYDSAIPFQGLYPKELKEESQRFLHMFIGALFTAKVEAT